MESPWPPAQGSRQTLLGVLKDPFTRQMALQDPLYAQIFVASPCYLPLGAIVLTWRLADSCPGHTAVAVPLRNRCSTSTPTADKLVASYHALSDTACLLATKSQRLRKYVHVLVCRSKAALVQPAVP